MNIIIPPDATPLKRCSACPDPEENKWHPATTEFFHHDKGCKDGLYTLCKQCKNKKHKEQRSRSEVRKHEQDYRQVYYNRPEVRDRTNTWRRENHQRPEIKERHHIQAKKQYNRPEVKARQLARQKERYNHPETRKEILTKQKEYQKHPIIKEKERIRSKKRHSRPEYKEWKRAWQTNQRAHRKNIPGTYTAQQIREQYDRQKGKCYYCRKRVRWGEHHIEHTFPLSREYASNDISHLVIACAPCNLSKGNKYPWEWPEGGRLL